MSKFGAHVTIGRRNGFGEALKACYDAGSPVPVLYAVDQNLMPDIERYSPSTILIYRTQIDGLDFPLDIWQGNPTASADKWFDRCYPAWMLNHADYYSATNEPNPGTLAQFDWLNAFELRLMVRADQIGIRLAIGGHSTGTPSDDGNLTRYDRWARLVPSMQYAKSQGHILLLHEYGFDKTLPESSPHHALRYRYALDYLSLSNADPLVVISECSDYNGFTGDNRWLDGVKWYDEQVMSDERVLGFCAYQLGMAENWYKLIPQWRDWVINHPATVITPPPQVVTVTVTLPTSHAPAHAAWVIEHGGTVTGV